MVPRQRILIIDDDPALRRYLRRSFGAAGYVMRDMAPGRSALGCIAERKFDLVILGLDGAAGDDLKLIRGMRELSAVPIVALSCRNDEGSIVKALESGADDYVINPFDIDILIARARSAMRRTLRERGQPPRFVSGDLEVDLVSRRVWSRGREVHLAAKPYRVLQMLVENAGRVLSHEELLKSVWGIGKADRIAYLRLAIRGLRRALEADSAHPMHIVTEPRVGYRLGMPGRVGRRYSRNRQAPGQQA